MIYEASPEGCQIRYLGSLSARQASVLHVGSLRRAPRTRPKMWLFLYRTVPLAKATLALARQSLQLRAAAPFRRKTASIQEPISYHVTVLTIASCRTCELLPCGQQGGNS